MAYTIEKSDGSVLGIVPSDTEYTPGTPLAGTGNTLDLTMYGRGKLRWGERVNENFIFLLENFASATSPSNPLTGQLWYDVPNDTFFYWDGTMWVELAPQFGLGSPITFSLGDTEINGDLTMNGDIIFEIPSSGLPDDSNGIYWIGNTDQARLYVEEI